MGLEDRDLVFLIPRLHRGLLQGALATSDTGGRGFLKGQASALQVSLVLPSVMQGLAFGARERALCAPQGSPISVVRQCSEGERGGQAIWAKRLCYRTLRG